jgi:N-acetylglucosaminyl-diphospho-decaprenol L-rhamnosyltransferase
MGEGDRETAADGLSADRPLLDIIVVTSAGARELLRDCLDSLRRNPLRTAPSRIHLTDNASADGTAEMVRSAYSEVELAVLPTDRGFPYANNHWIARTEAPLVLLLNPDTVLTESAVDRMVEVIQERPRVAAAGCRLVLRDGTFDHAAKRSFPTPLAAVAHFMGLGARPGASHRLAQYRAPEVAEEGSGEVDSVNGAFMLMRREAIEDVGLLDEGYPTPGLEDLDWCFRAKRRGWQVWYEGTVAITHVKGGATVSARRRGRYRSLRHNIAFHRSLGRFYRKCYSGEHPLIDLAAYLAIGIKFGVSVARSTIARRGIG